MNQIIPVGKIPPQILAKIISASPTSGNRVLLGPGIGLDCAVLDFGATALVLKTEPITFATANIGWYAVQIAANDIATTGAVPKWLLLTALLPEKLTTPSLVEQISTQVAETCRTLDIALIGGHTEVTVGIDRTILVSTLIGEVAKDRLITPRGARPGDRIILTKGIPIEATALLAAEFPDQVTGLLTVEEIDQARAFLYHPGISVLRDAQIAAATAAVTAMHDPTEGGIATALWELAEACRNTLLVETEKIHVPELSQKICSAFHIDPFGAIASGALLLTVMPEKQSQVLTALASASIQASVIGEVQSGQPVVYQKTAQGFEILKRFERDEITRVYESSPNPTGQGG